MRSRQVVAKKHFTEALQDLKRDFSQKLDHGKPVIVEAGGTSIHRAVQASVPKQLGWRAETHWGQVLCLHGYEFLTGLKALGVVFRPLPP